MVARMVRDSLWLDAELEVTVTEDFSVNSNLVEKIIATGIACRDELKK